MLRPMLSPMLRQWPRFSFCFVCTLLTAALALAALAGPQVLAA
jgi:hypothetical protein